MLGSSLFYLGAVAVMTSLGAFVWRRYSRRVRRLRLMVAPIALGIVGAALAVIGLALPSRDTVVAPPRTALDAVMPRYQFAERHGEHVVAPPQAVDDAIRQVTADEIRGYRVLTWLRRFGRRGPAGLLDAPAHAPMVDLAARSGFRRLVDVPEHDLVFGVAAPASSAAGENARSASSRAVGSAARGYASIAIAFTSSRTGAGVRCCRPRHACMLSTSRRAGASPPTGGSSFRGAR